MKETVEDVKLTPQDKVQNCTLEQTGEVIQLISQGRIPGHVVDQIIDNPRNIAPTLTLPNTSSSTPLMLSSHRFGNTVSKRSKSSFRSVCNCTQGRRLRTPPVLQAGKVTVAETDAADQPGALIQGLDSEGAVTKDNYLLSKFRLDGTQSAPCGAPEVEVTFIIDAKELLNVSAQDKSTEAQQERLPHRSEQQQTVQWENEEEKGRKVEKRKREEQGEEEKEIGKETKMKEGGGRMGQARQRRK